MDEMIDMKEQEKIFFEKIKNTEKMLDEEQIKKAYYFAEKAHEGQFRSSGEPYFSHPVAVASILVNFNMDTESIIASLLHDVVEDTKVSIEEIKNMFNTEVANLVDGVTKLGKIPYSFYSKEEQQAENIRKMLLAMSEDIRVIVIKLADRLHNMRTIQYLPEQKRRDKSLETMEIFAPIAHRLGIRAVKEELEDLAIRNLDSVAVAEIENALNLKKNERENVINIIKNNIKERISEFIPDIYIDGRVKKVNGIYRKMYIQNKSFEEIYDIYAVRIIVDTTIDCYNVLGLIHDMYRPIPGRFKDYISTPKPNLYQSLHTTVVGKEAIPFEVQIRTWDMHQTAEYGIAAHWKYKLGLNDKESDSQMKERLNWIRKMLENQKDAEDVEDLVRTIKSDLASEEVFVLTPRGGVISLPFGATVIDFAYAIHSAIGNRMIGAKVDGRIVPIDYKVRTGEIIEILTSKSETQGPTRDWIKIVKTSEARSKIRQWFKRERRDENIAEGKAELEREFSRNNIRLFDKDLKEFLQNLATRQHFEFIEDLYAAIGYGGIILSKIMPRIKEEYNKLIKSSAFKIEDVIISKPIKTEKSIGGVIIEDVDNCLVKFSRCCNPLPGDNIIGFITRGYGVSIHRRDCVNVPVDLSSSDEPERWVKASWDDVSANEFKSQLNIVAADRQGLIADITSQLTSMHLMIHAINASESKQGHAYVNVTIAINNLDHLQGVISRLNNISGVQSIERL